MIGVNETNLGQAAALRSHVIDAVIAGSITELASALPIGSAGGAAVNAWTPLNVSGRLQCPITPALQINMGGAGSDRTVRFWVQGIDQYGEPVEEVTPLLTLGATTLNTIWLATTMAHVQQVYYQSQLLNTAVDTISIGTSINWDAANGAETFHGINNQGIGLYRWMKTTKAGGSEGDNVPRRKFDNLSPPIEREIQSVTIHRISDDAIISFDPQKIVLSDLQGAGWGGSRDKFRVIDTAGDWTDAAVRMVVAYRTISTV